MHAAGVDELGGLHVTDIWESAEQMQQFFESRLKPGLAPFNLAPPNLNIYPLHNADAYPGIGQYGSATASAG